MNDLIKMVSRAYETIEHYELHFHKLEYLPFKNFTFSLNKLERSIGENQLYDEILLNDVISSLRRYRFYVIASLIPFNKYEGIIDKGKLDQIVKRCIRLFPTISNELENCYIIFEELVKSNNNPIFNYISKYFNDTIPTGVLLKVTSDLEFTKKTLQSISDDAQFSIIGHQSLRLNTFFDRLIVIGPTRWFPLYIYNSPHAKEIHTITYRWLDRKFYEDSYLKGRTVRSTIFSGRKILFHEENSIKNNENEEEILDTDIETYINYNQIEQKVFSKINDNNKENENDEIVSAKLVVLNGSQGIFLEDIPTKNIFSIYPEGDHFTVGKVSLKELDKGSYILIRTGTKKDLIRLKADEIIGESAHIYRNFHKKWKKRLKHLIKNYGLLRVQSLLTQYGASNPTEINIRNWISEDNIRPGLKKDFLAILKLVDLEKEASKHIKVADLLRRSHLEAGNWIRKQLISLIKNTDLSGLELEGKHKFYLPNEKEVSFTAYRVEHISEKEYKVPESIIKDVFDLN
jgi:hypothetical protein